MAARLDAARNEQTDVGISSGKLETSGAKGALEADSGFDPRFASKRESNRTLAVGEVAEHLHRWAREALDSGERARIFNANIEFAREHELSSVAIAQALLLLRRRLVVSPGVVRDWQREGRAALEEETNQQALDETVNGELRLYAETTDWRHGDLSRQLHTWYDRFNNWFFNNALPEAAIAIERVSKRTLGLYRFERDGLAIHNKITINEQHLDLGPAETLETLLHEMVHSWEHQIEGRARGGSYHTRKFQAKAHELGIPTDQRGRSLGVQGDGPFARLLVGHGVHISPHKLATTPQKKTTGSRSRLRKWVCACDRGGAWVSFGVTLEARCMRCGATFVRADGGGAPAGEAVHDRGTESAATTTRVTSSGSVTLTAAAMKRELPPLDPFGREVNDAFVRGEVARGAWTPHEVTPEVSGLPRPTTIFLAKRKSELIKWAFHGDAETFCPPIWADIAIGSGACGLGCRSCFLMLTHRLLRDPLRPIVYSNGEDFDRAVRRWLGADSWNVEGKGVQRRRKEDAIGLGIDCADSLLFEGVTGHARRLIPLFTSHAANPLGNPLILLTKSANTHYLAEISDKELARVDGRVKHVVLTMSLNPEEIADLWEGKYPDTGARITPPIAKRMAALRAAQDMGFEVRARIDPILTPAGWEEQYATFFAEMANGHGLRPTMLTLGTHREKTPQLDTFRKKWGLPAMDWTPEKEQARDGTHRRAVDRPRLYEKMREIIVHAFKGTNCMPWISLCKETHQVRRETGLCSANCNCLPETPAPRRRLQIYGA